MSSANPRSTTLRAFLLKRNGTVALNNATPQSKLCREGFTGGIRQRAGRDDHVSCHAAKTHCGIVNARENNNRKRTMSYIDSTLLAGEHVIYRTRLHWLLFMVPVLFSACILAPIAWFLASGTWSHYAWIPLAICAVILLATYIKRQSSDFAVTNKRVMMKVGVFSTRSIELVLNKVEAIAVNQSLMGRIFGYGDIVVTGSGGTKESFSHIQGPLAFRRAVQSVTDTQATSGQPAPPASGPISTQ